MKYIGIILGIVFMLSYVNAASVAVSPPSLNFEVELGESDSGSFFILNLDDEKVSYEISTEGENLISLSDKNVEIAANEDKEIEVSVKGENVGNYETIIYVKSASQGEEDSGTSFEVTSGVGIRVKISVKEKEGGNNNGNQNNGGGSSGGGSSGDSAGNVKKNVSIINISSAQNTCIENWQCSEWNECKNGKEKRECFEINDCGSIKNKPEEIRDCSDEERKGGSNSWLLGAVIGADGKVRGFVPVVFIALIAGLTLFVFVRRRNKRRREMGF